MSNRYLFKAKRTDNGEWIEGDLYQSGKWLNVFEKDTVYIGNDELLRDVDPSTICQCTRLHDKNGKAIWENDRCCVYRFGVLAYGVIKYLEGCFCFVEDGFGNILRICDVRTNDYEIKVEGNLFDNPELLGEGAEG